MDKFIGLDKKGLEHPDPRPVEIPTRLKLPQRQVDRVREIIRQEMSRKAEEGGYESFAEADDFDIPGEDPVSPYEEVFEPVLTSDKEHDTMSSGGNGATVKESDYGKRSGSESSGDKGTAADDRSRVGDGDSDVAEAEQSPDGSGGGGRGEAARGGYGGDRRKVPVKPPRARS